MKVIGIVGGIGSGKSFVSETIANLYGAYVIEADQVGHMVMIRGNKAYEPVVERFGQDILDEAGEIDRKKLGNIVFNNPDQLEYLNHIIHKEVFDYLREHITYLRDNPFYDYVIIEAALLIVEEFMPLVDSLWYVHSDREIRIDRLMNKRQMSRQRIEQIMSQQHTESFYKSYADQIVENNGSVSDLVEVINRIMANEMEASQ